MAPTNLHTKAVGIATLPAPTNGQGYVIEASAGYPAITSQEGVQKRGILSRRNLMVAASILLVVALASASAFAYIGLRSDLRSTEGDLVSNKKQLSTTKKQLSTTQGELTSRTSERDNLQTQLTAAQNELTGVKNSLSDAKNKVELQSGQIDTLKSCLNGVMTALVYVAEGYFQSAISALDAVSISCESASKLF